MTAVRVTYEENTPAEVPLEGEAGGTREPLASDRTGESGSIAESGRTARTWMAIEGALSRAVGPELNPLAHSGSLAALCFGLALLSGAYLFFFYQVAAPYASVRDLDDSLFNSVLRGWHRYGSRGFMLFTVVHALRFALSGRFRGPRWLAWETGVLQVAVAWFVGVTGYFLIWDQQAQALTTALVRLLDAAMIFVQPFSLTFLANDLVRDNLFFIILFVHLTVPVLGMLFFWLHLSRVSRAGWMPPLMAGVVLSVGTTALSVLRPARSGPAADLGWLPQSIDLDPWYNLLVPALLNLPTSWLVGGVAVATLILVLLPWLGRRGRPAVAEVDAERCNGCSLCAQDCPYAAITMRPRGAEYTGARPTLPLAHVLASRCVSCGICLGSCTPGAIALGDLTLDSLKARVDAHLEPARLRGEPALLVIAGHGPYRVPLPPGVRLLEISCAGAINPSLVRYALAAGAKGVLVASCRSDLCAFREGGHWAAERARHQRRPGWSLPVARRARLVEIVPGDDGALRQAVEAYRRELDGEASVPAPAPPPVGPRPWAKLVLGTLLLLALVGSLGWDARIQAGPADRGLLKVALRTEAPLMQAQMLSAEENEKLLPHMRGQQSVSRERMPLRLTVQLDGRAVLQDVFRARGFRQDGPTYGYAEVALPPGEHHLSVLLEDASGGGHLVERWEGDVHVEPQQVLVASYGALGTGFVIQ